MPIVLLFVLFTLTAHSTALVNRYQYLSTDVLPDGLWTFGVSRGESLGKGGSSFSGNGAKISNLDYFSKDVTYNDLLDELDDPLERELASAAFDVYGLPQDGLSGHVVNDVSVTQKNETYVLGRGFGKRTSVFAIFPVVTLDMRFTNKFELSDSMKDLAARLMRDGQYREAQEILEKSQNALSQRLSETGTDSNYPTRITTLANVFLTHRYKLKPDGKLRVSSDSSIVIPAGEKSGPSDFLYLRLNEEQFSYRQALTTSFAVTPKTSLLSGAYYHKRFPFSKARRIPRNEKNPLSPEIDSHTRMQYGDTYGLSTQLAHNFSDSWMVYVGQSLELKNQDRVSGKKYESQRYNYLEKNTGQNLKISYLGFAWNSIQSFLSHKFLIPMDVNLQYAYTGGGKNTFNNQAVALNVMVFYK